MAPAKKLKTGGKQVAAVNGVSPSKYARVSKKPKLKKRKLADMLGPQWSRRELERFYEGFRKYGHDWKKIAHILCNRSAEMVEALYHMNRAYLSLPEGTASVVGLIAMMTDHYSVLDGSGSERNSESSPAASLDPQKYVKESVRAGFSKEHIMCNQSAVLSDSCLSSLKRIRGCDGMQLYIPVKKRTPRVAVPSLVRRDDIVDISPAQKARRLKVDMKGDEFAHGAALFLTDARHKAGSFKVSPQSERVTKDIKHSKVSKGKNMLSKSIIAQAKDLKTGMGDTAEEASLDSNGAESDGFLGDSGKSQFVDYKKGKKEKKGTSQSDKRFDGMPEAYNGIRGRLIVTAGKRCGIEASKLRMNSTPHRASKQESKELFTEDESLAFDALRTLADLSLAMPSILEPVESSRESANGGDMTLDSGALSDVTLINENTDGVLKRKKKRKIHSSKMEAESQSEPQSGKPVRTEPVAEEDIKAGDIVKELEQISAPTKQCKSARSSEVTSINDQQMLETDVAVSSSQVPSIEPVMFPSKPKCRRKRDRILISNGRQIPSISGDLHNNSSTVLQGTHLQLEEKLCCLSSSLVRRWCGFEWFYSAIDYPWFAKKEFVEYLNHVGLGHIPKLSRVEWGVIRSSLGKPRRFSERFLHEERDKLQQYRDSVRAHYDQLRGGLRDGLPTDLARPLSVGQRVIAIHPKTREFHDGSILTVDHDKCRVQFDCPELGVEFVMDINCMPWSPLENMPEVLRSQIISFGYGGLRTQNLNGPPTFPPSQYMGSQYAWICAPSSKLSVANQTKANLVTLASHSTTEASGYFNMTPSSVQVDSCNAVQVLHRGGNIQHPTLQSSHFLDKKVSTLPSHPDQHAFYPGSISNTPQCTGGSAEVNGNQGECDEIRIKIAEIVKGSRMKAHMIVDAAVQAISSGKGGEDAYTRIQEALDFIGQIRSQPKPMISMTRSQPKPMISMTTSQCPANGNLVSQKHADAKDTEKNEMTKSYSNGESDLKESHLPSELITSCVATFLMIQSCTERQYPPAAVARILDSAVTSLHPSCPQNLPLYREIQMCLGRIKTQILALIPS